MKQKKHIVKNGKVYFFDSKDFDVYQKYHFKRDGGQILLHDQVFLLQLLSDNDKQTVLAAVDSVFRTGLSVMVQYARQGEVFMALVKTPIIKCKYCCNS